jgi:hypothetical protein
MFLALVPAQMFEKVTFESCGFLKTEVRATPMISIVSGVPLQGAGITNSCAYNVLAEFLKG